MHKFNQKPLTLQEPWRIARGQKSLAIDHVHVKNAIILWCASIWPQRKTWQKAGDWLSQWDINYSVIWAIKQKPSMTLCSPHIIFVVGDEKIATSPTIIMVIQGSFRFCTWEFETSKIKVYVIISIQNKFNHFQHNIIIPSLL